MTPSEKIRHLIGQTDWLVREALKAGKKAHLIWDADHVLVDGMSHDVFEATGRDVAKYHACEERQLFHPLPDGPWAEFALDLQGRGVRCHIVTARSGYTAFRVMAFCALRGLRPDDMFFVGTQSKRPSYDLILSRLCGDPDMHVICVDDSGHHIADFNTAARAIGVDRRCVGVTAPRLTSRTKDDLRRHADEVLQERSGPFLAGKTLSDPRALLRLKKMLQGERGEMLGEIDDMRDDV